jgi:hypothetical protein
MRTEIVRRARAILPALSHACTTSGTFTVRPSLSSAPADAGAAQHLPARRRDRDLRRRRRGCGQAAEALAADAGVRGKP